MIYENMTLYKHDLHQSKMSRFFHGGFFAVNGLLMHVTRINVYNTNVGNTKIGYGIISAQKCLIIYPKQFSCSENSKQFKVVV